MYFCIWRYRAEDLHDICLVHGHCLEHRLYGICVACWFASKLRPSLKRTLGDSLRMESWRRISHSHAMYSIAAFFCGKDATKSRSQWPKVSLTQWPISLSHHPSRRVETCVIMENVTTRHSAFWSVLIVYRLISGGDSGLTLTGYHALRMRNLISMVCSSADVTLWDGAKLLGVVYQCKIPKTVILKCLRICSLRWRIWNVRALHAGTDGLN